MSESKVREHKISGGKVPGRKAGKLQIHIQPGETGYLEMKIDPDEGSFIAISGGCYYEAPTKAELKAHMEERARMARVITWTRYIVLSYEAHGDGKWSRRRHLNHKDTIKPNEEGLLDDVSGVHFSWEINDFSDPITVPGHTRPRRKVRVVWDSGDVGPEDWHRDDDLPALAILFSPEILETLKRLRHGLGAIHMGISKLLAGSPEAIAARLANPNTKLLGNGEP